MFFNVNLRAEFIHCKNSFYQQLLEYSFDLYSIQRETFKDIFVEPLWFNVNIIVGGSPIFYRQWWNQSINQSILFLIRRYIINALSAVQWNTHITLNTYIYIYSEIQHTYKHSYKAAFSAQIQCLYFMHTHSHTRGRCDRPAPSLFSVIHL